MYTIYINIVNKLIRHIFSKIFINIVTIMIIISRYTIQMAFKPSYNHIE
jgi:hypothetical protein